MNELFRLTARITWLFIPSWLIIYVFWIWPVRPRKFVSESSELRRRLKKHNHLRARNRCLNAMICCECCRYPEYGSASSTPRRFDFDGSEVDGDEKRQRLISEDGDSLLSLSHRERDHHLQESMAQNGDGLHNGEEQGNLYSLQKSMMREESSSSDSTDSTIWDQHPTQNVTSPNAMSRSVTRQSQVSPQHRFQQR